MKRGRKRKKVAITSGDKVVDWVFQMVCDVLKNEDIQIVVVAGMEAITGKIGLLNSSNRCRHKYDGYCIHLDYKLSERGKWRIFFHELLHILFENAKEKAILCGENLLWARMCEEQKQIIAWYFKKLLRKSK